MESEKQCEQTAPVRRAYDNDRFRRQFHTIGKVEQLQIDTIKQLAESLANNIEVGPPSREKSLALTKLEEAVMWAVKGVTA